MKSEAINRQFKIFSVLQALIILWGGLISVKVNIQLGFNWLILLAALIYVGLLFTFTYYLYKYHRLSAIWAILIWAMQLVTIESDYLSWTMSLGIALSPALNLDEASISINLIALAMLIWVTYITLAQRKLIKAGPSVGIQDSVSKSG